MFYGASPIIFELAKQLRNNLTDAEVLLWHYLSNNQLGVRFKQQHPIYNYIADFYCHKFKLVVELDGSIHKVDLIKEKDKARQEIIESFGIKVLRFTNKELYQDVNLVLQKIKENLKDEKVR
jgi:very-short-patch-repair endonuclease